MRVDPAKIAALMERQSISPMRLIVSAQITPVYWNKIIHTGTCCEEIALTIADTLSVELKDIT